MEDDDGEVDRDKHPLHTLLKAVRARIARSWHFGSVCRIVSSCKVWCFARSTLLVRVSRKFPPCLVDTDPGCYI